MAAGQYVLPVTGLDDLDARLAEGRESGAACLREVDVDSIDFFLHPSRSSEVVEGVREQLNTNLLR